MFENRHLPRSHLLHGKKIAIVGGGPAGLTLARLLSMAAIEATVFERDAGEDARGQGGSLDLHENSGQLALRRCGLDDRFLAASRPEGQASVVYDKHGTLMASSSPEQETESTPEIDRGELRDLLRGSLVEKQLIWGRQLTEVAPTEDGRYRLVFTDGENMEADLVVGCDGAWSRVRAALTSARPFYTGVTFIETRLAAADERHPEIARLVGPGSAMSLGDHKGLLAQRNGDGSIRVYVALRQSEAWMAQNDIPVGDVSALRAALLKRFSDWSPKLVAMLRESEDAFLPWPLHAMPADHVWDSRPGLTVIGDAAHVMPPFLGAGANMAMLDAVELTDHLTSGDFADLAAAQKAFEQGMRERMVPLIQQSIATQDILFADDAPAGLISLMSAKS